MDEGDYINATELTRLRIARAQVADLIPKTTVEVGAQRAALAYIDQLIALREQQLKTES